MLQIQPSQVTPALTSLFSQNTPSRLRCFAVLAGQDAGKILTDDADNPSWATVCEAGDNTIYLGGELDSSTVQAIFNNFRQGGEVLFGYWPGDQLEALLPPDPSYIGTTLEFLDRPSDGSGLSQYLQAVPQGFDVRPMDADLLARSVWYEDTLRVHGSAENFLARGVGMCLMDGNEIACEASAGAAILNTREMGVYTVPQYRGRNFATITCAYLIKAIEQAGLKTYWNCAASNLPSAAVARKLDYQTEKEYNLRAWSPIEENVKDEG